MRRTHTAQARVVTLCFVAGCGAFEPGSTPVHTDLSGTWPVTFQVLSTTSTRSPCTLTGLVLSIEQPGGRVSGNSWNAEFHGTYTGSTLTCGTNAAVAEPGGTLSGSLKDSFVTINLSSGGLLSGRIYRPSMSWTFVQLQGENAESARWVSSDAGEGRIGNWIAGPIETTTLVR